ncbi:TlpA disulfide reductase family protein [Nocardioides sp. L-11A]|uniref:TlpA family protein disulfide reductase n=1 Tax=Nocardioides sp. L-11A TaxID=3043848 RepID=UPI002499C90F|nr:TlpA disulfide reductase family protein [Nocardioides sp. L-11A]
MQRPLVMTIALLAILAGGAGWLRAERGAGDPADRPAASDLLGWREVDGVPWPQLPSVTPVDSSPNDLPASGTVLVNFWASTCGPCRDEMPMLQRLAGTGRVAVVGVSRDLDDDSARAALDEFGVSYPNFRDRDGHLAEALADVVPFNGVPSTVLVVDGRIRWAHIGDFDSYDELVRDVDARVAGGAPGR